MDLISEYRGKKAIILKPFDKNNYVWAVAERNGMYGKEIIITGDIIDKIAEALTSKNHENTHDSDSMSCTGKNCPLGFGEVKRCTVHNCEDRTKPQTNFEKLAESVEALAEFFATYGISCVQRGNKCDTGKNCKECIKEWLQKEADDGI